MLPPIVVNVLAILIALLCVALVLRIVLRWWKGSAAESAHENRSTPADVAATSAEPVVDFVEAVSHDASDATVEPTYASKITRGDDVADDWQQQSVFRGNRAARNDLPHLRPDDVPTADPGDYVLGATLTPALASLLPESEERRRAVREELVNAGYYEPHAYENLAALRYAGIMLMLVLFGGLVLIVPRDVEIVPILGLVLGPILAWSLPRLYVRGRAADRLSEIERGLPDMLDMLNMCVSQGLTVQQGLARVGREMTPAYPALARELEIVAEQSRVGGLEQALHNFERRIDVPEVHSFVALLTQTERMGTSVSAALVDYSDGMRESLRQRADAKANQATFKLLFPTVLCLMPAVYLFLLGPALIELNKFMHDGGYDAVNQGTTFVRDFGEPTP